MEATRGLGVAIFSAMNTCFAYDVSFLFKGDSHQC